MELMGFVPYIIIFLIGLGCLILMSRYFINLHYNKKSLEAIHKVEAKVAVLRMLLKAKIKKKLNAVTPQIAKEKTLSDEIRPKLDAMANLNFGKTQDYQTLLNYLKEVVVPLEVYIQKAAREKNPTAYAQKLQDDAAKAQELQKAGAPPPDPDTEVLQKVLKHDKAHIYIVKEIIETTLELKNKIEVYNTEIASEKNQLKVPEPILLEKFELICALIDEDRLKSINLDDSLTLDTKTAA